VAATLDMVSCGELTHRHPNEISGGQQQRVAVARAIVGGSRVVLFDEPLSAVDARVREELRHELVSLQRTLGFASVYITHDQTEAMAIGHRVAVLAEGTIIQLAEPRELYRQPASTEVAQFMGATNQFGGTISDAGDGSWVVETQIGTVAAASSGEPRPGGPTATVIIRPEYWRISAAKPDSATNVWPALIESSLFLGYCTEYRARLGNGHLVTVRSDALTPLRGSAWLHVAPADVRVVAA
jgi:ABC-type Fe3+/spermidine/putrescine transport system ATPase subunit